MGLGFAAFGAELPELEARCHERLTCAQPTALAGPRTRRGRRLIIYYHGPGYLCLLSRVGLCALRGCCLPERYSTLSPRLLVLLSFAPASASWAVYLLPSTLLQHLLHVHRAKVRVAQAIRPAHQAGDEAAADALLARVRWDHLEAKALVEPARRVAIEDRQRHER